MITESKSKDDELHKLYDQIKDLNKVKLFSFYIASAKLEHLHDLMYLTICCAVSQLYDYLDLKFRLKNSNRIGFLNDESFNSCFDRGQIDHFY